MIKLIQSFEVLAERLYYKSRKADFTPNIQTFESLDSTETCHRKT